jgi:hypothetical protein|tara:strand:- start:997 stop:1341 length:345 start_codon:yes stop_codon:yes gene_type:complete
MAIINGQISIADKTLLTVPASKRYAITTILVCNTQPEDTGGTNDTQLDLHVVPSGQTKGNSDPNANQILNNLKIAGGDTFTFDTEKLVLEAGDKIITASQSPANLVATISYLEV